MLQYVNLVVAVSDTVLHEIAVMALEFELTQP
jgi:hypothetical protein